MAQEKSQNNSEDHVELDLPTDSERVDDTPWATGKSAVRINASDTRAVELTAITGALVRSAKSSHKGKRFRETAYSSKLGILSTAHCLGSFSVIQKQSEYYHAIENWSDLPKRQEDIYLCGRLWAEYAMLFKGTEHEENWKRYSNLVSRKTDINAGVASNAMKERFFKLFKSQRLEYLAIPVDGSIDLHNGESGVASVISAAEPKTFEPYFTEENTPEKSGSVKEWWRPAFVILTGNRKVSRELGALFKGSQTTSKIGVTPFQIPGGELKRKTSVQPVRFDHGFIEHTLEILSQLSSLVRPLSLGLGMGPPMGKRQKTQWETLRNQFRCLNKYGSPVVEAITSQIGNIGTDAFLSIVDPVQATIIAAATIATESECVFYPVHIRKESNRLLDIKPHLQPTVESAGKTWIEILRQTELINLIDEHGKERDFFVSLAGITDSALLRGVRFRKFEFNEKSKSWDTGKIQTHAMSIRNYSKSTRNVLNQHDVSSKSRKRFRFTVPEGKDASDFDYGEFEIGSGFRPSTLKMDVNELVFHINGQIPRPKNSTKETSADSGSTNAADTDEADVEATDVATDVEATDVEATDVEATDVGSGVDEPYFAKLSQDTSSEDVNPEDTH